MSFVATVTLKTKHVLQHGGTEGVSVDSGSSEGRDVEHLQPMKFGNIGQPSCHSVVGARSV